MNTLLLTNVCIASWKFSVEKNVYNKYWKYYFKNLALICKNAAKVGNNIHLSQETKYRLEFVF